MRNLSTRNQMNKTNQNKSAQKCLINGVAADHINIDDRSIHYGDGLFETILCNGNNLYYWSQHYQRLKESTGKLSMSCPAEKTLLDDVSKLLEANKTDSACVIKIIVSRGAGERGYKISKNCSANRFVLFSAIDEEYSSLLSKKLLSGDLCLCKQQVSINENLAGLKHLNRLDNVLARSEWNTDYIDGLMLNANHSVIEGTMSNLFAVKDNQMFTPDLKLSGVNGVMREVIIDVASSNNIKISIENLTIDDLENMDELFISNSLIGMKSVNKLNDWQYDDNDIAQKVFTVLLKEMNDNVQAV